MPCSMDDEKHQLDAEQPGAAPPQRERPDEADSKQSEPQRASTPAAPRSAPDRSCRRDRRYAAARSRARLRRRSRGTERPRGRSGCVRDGGHSGWAPRSVEGGCSAPGTSSSSRVYDQLLSHRSAAQGTDCSAAVVGTVAGDPGLRRHPRSLPSPGSTTSITTSWPSSTATPTAVILGQPDVQEQLVVVDQDDDQSQHEHSPQGLHPGDPPALVPRP